MNGLQGKCCILSIDVAMLTSAEIVPLNSIFYVKMQPIFSKKKTIIEKKTI
jgi:hypothetical protein